MPFRSYLLTLTVALAACAPSRAQPALPDGFEAALDSVVADEMASNHVPGAAVVVVRDGEVLFQRGYGVADVATGRPVDPDRTLFRIGSITKALTGLAVTRLVDDGRLAWDTPAARFTDAIENRSGSDAPVTVWNLLTHTGGFDQIGLDRRVREYELSLADRKALRPGLGEWLEDGNLRRVTPPSRQFNYDTYGISLAGLVLARATGRSYAEAMREELFAPLGMNDSYVEVDEGRFGDLAVGYGWVDGAYVAQPYELYMSLPASSIDATPADMGRLMQALTNGGANARGRLFSAEATAAVLAPQFRPHPDFVGATHGFQETPASPGPDGRVWAVDHGGTMLGYKSLLAFYPESNVAVFAVGNRDAEAGGDGVNLGSRVAALVRDRLVDVPAGPPYRGPYRAAAPDRDVDLSQYEGQIVGGTYCHACTDEELARGAWRRGQGATVRAEDGRLLIGENAFLPTADDDVFVHEGGGAELYFGRDAEGRVAFLVASDSPNSFELVHD